MCGGYVDRWLSVKGSGGGETCVDRRLSWRVRYVDRHGLVGGGEGGDADKQGLVGGYVDRA